MLDYARDVANNYTGGSSAQWPLLALVLGPWLRLCTLQIAEKKWSKSFSNFAQWDLHVRWVNIASQHVCKVALGSRIIG